MVKVFFDLREAKKFIQTLPKGSAYKLLNVLGEQYFVFYAEKEKTAVKPQIKTKTLKSSNSSIPQKRYAGN